MGLSKASRVVARRNDSSWAEIILPVLHRYTEFAARHQAHQLKNTTRQAARM